MQGKRLVFAAGIVILFLFASAGDVAAGGSTAVKYGPSGAVRVPGAAAGTSIVGPYEFVIGLNQSATLVTITIEDRLDHSAKMVCVGDDVEDPCREGAEGCWSAIEFWTSEPVDQVTVIVYAVYVAADLQACFSTQGTIEVIWS